MKKFKNIKLMLIGLFAIVSMNLSAKSGFDRYEVENGMLYGITTGSDDVWFLGVLDNIPGEWEWKGDIVVPKTANLKNDAGTGRKNYNVIGIEDDWFVAEPTVYSPYKTQDIAGADIKTLQIDCRLDAKAASGPGFGWSETVALVSSTVWTQLEKLIITDAHNVSTVAFAYGGAFPALKELKLGVVNDGLTITIADGLVKDSPELTTVTLPAADPLIIGADAFSGCTKLATLSFGENVKEIGDNAFSGIGITSLTFPAKVETVGAKAFSNNAKLATVTINHDKLTEIPGSAGADWFDGCAAITTLNINSPSIAKISAGAFADATGLKNLTIAGDALTTVEAGAFAAGISSLVNVDLSGTILTSVDDICSPTDSKNQLEKFVFPATLEGTLPSFEDCKKLTTVTIPDGIDGITSFKNCQKLTAINLSKTSVTSIPAYAFEMDEAITGKGQYVNGIQQYKTALATVTLNANTTEINAYAFDGCSKLETINLDALTKLKKVDDYAFYATIIPEVNLAAATDEDFKAIGDFAFADNTALTTVTLAPAVTTIGNSAFGFTGVDKNGLSLGKLETVNGLNSDVIESIGVDAFWGAAWATLTLTDATNEKFTTIPTGAFGYNKNLATVALPVQIDEIGAQAFVNDIALSSINLNQTCITVLPNIFTYDYNSKEVSLDNLKKIELKKDTEVTTADGDPLPELEVIGEYAFQFTGLTDVVIPESVWSFGDDLKTTTSDEYGDGYDDNGRVFQGCLNLKTFDWRNAKVPTMPFYTFRGDVKLTDVWFMTTATADIIYDEIFFMCNNVKVYVTNDSYKKTDAEGYGNDNRKYSVLQVANNKVFKFEDKNFNKADEYYYATYYNENNSSWFDATKFEVFAAVVDGSKVKLEKATVDGGYYKVPRLDVDWDDDGDMIPEEDEFTSNAAKAICVVRSKDKDAVPELNSNDGTMAVSTLPAVNHLQYCYYDGYKMGSKINYVFKLGRKSDKIAFYRISSGEFKEGSVFIDAEEASAARGLDGLEIVIEGESTGINGIIEENVENFNFAPVYNLQGVRVNNAQKGIYIKNGKKFVK